MRRAWGGTALMFALPLVGGLLGGHNALGAGTVSPPKAGHVFLIEIENEGYADAYITNPNPYLSRVLPKQGELLTRYYGIGHVSLDNYIAELSGQAPNPNTQSDCQNYTDFEPSPAVFDGSGQAVGAGCVYPSAVKTLPDQLTASGHSWKAYMQDMGNTPGREDDRCGAPGNSFGTGTQDDTQAATATDQYAARHNPFIYFHSIVDSELCHTNVVPLSQLAADLAHPADFSWITPNLCSDGHDNPCIGTNEAGGHAGGLKAVDLFLAKYVPMIEKSPAFKQDGLLIITTDEAQTSDVSACCGEQPGPDSPLPGITGGGGGLVGTLVIGHCVLPGSKNATPYNHYALLRSLENNFGISTGGSDGLGHLGYAGAAGLRPFGTDVFGGCVAGGAGPVVGVSSVSPANTTHADARSLAVTGGLPVAPLAAGLALVAGATAVLVRRAT